jgi:hemerythrin-like domain-containing protein
MAMLRSTPDLAAAVGHLREDHDAFDQRLADLCERARTEDWRYLDEVWDALADDIDDHFAFEEDVLFPELAKCGPDDAALVRRLLAEHAEIRDTLQQLGVHIQLHEVMVSTIEHLVAQLRKHAAIEAERLYGWAERRADPDARVAG